MRKTCTILQKVIFSLVIYFCCFQEAGAQDLINASAVHNLLEKNAGVIGISDAELANTRISDAYYDQLSGATLVYLQQTYLGIDIYNRLQVLAFKNDKLISKTGDGIRQFGTTGKTIPASKLSAADAVRSVVQYLQIKMPSGLQPALEKPGTVEETEFGNLGIAANNIKAKLVWMYPENSKQLTLSWHVEIQPIGKADYCVVKVNAWTGTILGKDNYTVNDNWTKDKTGKNVLYKDVSENNFESPDVENYREADDVTSATYRVVPYPIESPKHPGGTPALRTDPWTLAPSGSHATTLKWNYNGTTYFDSTRGNNVLAQEDHNNNNGLGEGALSTTPEPDLTFDYYPIFIQQPTYPVNLHFAITNLFYWNNIMHDISYLYGFDEAAGNFQANNLGRGGKGGDYVLADAQDGSGTNNANFNTLPDGENPRMQMYLFDGNPKFDGDLDNGVITHEYTHGISNRLTGGPSNTACLENGEQGGEGWSDYFALMVTTNWATAQAANGTKPRPLGTYVEGEPITGDGIRLHPYSTDMTIDPWTYAGVKTSGGEAHDIGEIWCSVLWDMTWNIIQTDGINPNLYNATGTGGNTIALKLVMEGMKLQKCSPGFLDARDAILKADTLLFGGKYACTIWNSFARRGMGVFAKQGSSQQTDDQVEDFTSSLLPFFVKHVDKSTALQGEEITYTFHVQASDCNSATNFKITDTLPSNVTFVSGDGSYNVATRTVTIGGINLTAGVSHDYTVTVKINQATYFPSVTHLNQSFASASFPADWKNTSTSSTSWEINSNRKHSAPYSIFANDVIVPTNEAFVTKKAYPLQGVSTLSFWHYYDLEPGYDGGVVEISTNGGNTWIDAGPYMISNGYNGSIASTDDDTQLKGRNAFTGQSNNFIQTVINLTSFAGKNVKIRFLFATDVENQDMVFDGWYLDDIVLKSEAGVFNIAELFNNSGSAKVSSDTLTAINSGVFPVLLGSFTAVQNGKTSLLEWKTIQEFNTDKFIIERSADGNIFSAIDAVPAAGMSNSPKIYHYTDLAPLSGHNYYRLRQVDKDGKFIYSEVRLVNFGGSPQGITITPNPANSKIAVTVSGNTKTLQLYLMNTLGQQIKTYTMTGQYMQINLPDLAPGIYYIKISGEGVDTKHKLVIQ